MSGRASRFRLVAAFLTVYVVWGSTYLAIRFAIETLPGFLMAGARFLAAGGIVYAWARLRGAPRPEPIHWRSAAVLGGLFLLGGNGAVVWAEQRVPSGLTSLLIATMPLWVVVLDWLRPGGRRPVALVLGGLMLGFVGLCLLIRPGEIGAEAVDPAGAAVLVLGALSWACGSISSRYAPLPPSMLLGTAMEMIAGGALLVTAGVASGEIARLDPGAASARSLMAFAYLVVFGSIVAFNAFTWLLQNSTPTRVSTYAYVNPLVAVMLGWLLAGEALSAAMALGAAVILTGVACVTAAPLPTEIAGSMALPDLGEAGKISLEQGLTRD